MHRLAGVVVVLLLCALFVAACASGRSASAAARRAPFPGPPSLPCPAHAPPATSLQVAGLPMVRPGAILLELCRYSGMNARRPLELARSRRIRTGALIARLTRELNTLPQAHGIHNCPFDDGSKLLLRFGYRAHRPRPVVVGLTGCHFVTNGSIDRSGPSPEIARLVRQLVALTRRE